jgi:hypothetical protein
MDTTLPEPTPAATAARALADAGLPVAAPEPAAVLAEPWGELIQDLRPLYQGLEWQLGQRVWLQQGPTPFVDGSVPHLINNSGTLSRGAAELLLRALAEHPTPGPIRLLEIGAGLGLFARLLLDELRRLCTEQGRDEFERVEFWVTDVSPSSVAQWQRCGLFDAHADRVRPRVCRAEAAHALQPHAWHAVFANYVLDVLPAQVLRRVDSGWQQLLVRCWLRADAQAVRRRTPLAPDALRALAREPDDAALDRLLPLLPLLESEAVFGPIAAEALPAGLPEPTPGEAFAVNAVALQCLDDLTARLAPGGFVFISDYAAEPGTEARQQSSQRFGSVSTLGLNLPALDAHVRAAGLSVSAGGGDGGFPLRHRLLTRGSLPHTAAWFESAFSVDARLWRDEPLELARRLAATGHWALALQAYREAIERAPADWVLLTEAAAFAGTELADPQRAQQLAHAALARNPWTHPRAWTVLGDALAAQGRHEAALGCHEQALRIHPRDPQAWLARSRCCIALDRPEPALQAVASGLACDAESMWRHLLLEEQARALEALARNWGVERAAAARRSQ